MKYAFRLRTVIAEHGPQRGEVCFRACTLPVSEAPSPGLSLLEQGRESLVFGEGTPERILIPVDDIAPTLDDMLAVSLLRNKLRRRKTPRGLTRFVAYAAAADPGQRPGPQPLERSLLGMFLAIRQLEPWGVESFSDGDRAARFLSDWLVLEKAIFQAAAAGSCPSSALLFEGEENFPLRMRLLDDRAAYENDRFGACVIVSGGRSLVVVEQARSRLASYWTRADDGLCPEGRGRVAVERDGGWELSDAPDQAEALAAWVGQLAGDAPVVRRGAWARISGLSVSTDALRQALEVETGAGSQLFGGNPELEQLLADWPRMFPENDAPTLLPGEEVRLLTEDARGKAMEVRVSGLNARGAGHEQLSTGLLAEVRDCFRESDDLRRHRLALPAKVVRAEWRDRLLTLELRARFPLGDLASWRRNQDRLASEDVLTLITDIADALDLLHGWGIVHGEVRPDTVAIEESRGGLLRARLLDPGWGLPQGIQPCTAQLRFAPADLVAHSPADDVLSLGILTAYLIRGGCRPPFRTDSGQLAPDVLSLAAEADLVEGVGADWYASVSELLLEATAEDPEARPSVDELIRRIVAAGNVQAPRCITDPGASSGTSTDLGEGGYDTAPISRLAEADGAYLLASIRLKGKLGGGGFGEVFLGWDSRHDRQVAVKILGEQSMADEDNVERFHNEARLCLELDNPHLVRVYELNIFRGLRYMVMEYVDGWTSSDLLERVQNQGYTGFGEVLAITVAIAVTQGLCALHEKGIVHRDVKPSNIMVPRGEGDAPDFGRAKLIDLGIAKAPTVGLTATGSTFGSLGYMPPEQIDSAKHVGPEADVFSMGATMYSLLSGRPPFSGRVAETVANTMTGNYRPLSRYRTDLSRHIRELIDRCLHVVPDERYPDGAALLRALETARGRLEAE